MLLSNFIGDSRSSAIGWFLCSSKDRDTVCACVVLTGDVPSVESITEQGPEPVLFFFFFPLVTFPPPVYKPNFLLLF